MAIQPGHLTFKSDKKAGVATCDFSGICKCRTTSRLLGLFFPRHRETFSAAAETRHGEDEGTLLHVIYGREHSLDKIGKVRNR